MSIIQFERSINQNDIFEKQPLVNDLKKGKLNDIQVIAIIREVILNTAITLKFAENITLQQATVLASDVFDKMKYDTLEDIVLMFKKARQGDFGSLKGRLDSDIINSVIIPSYFDFKSENREIYQKKIKVPQIENKHDSEASEYNFKMFERMKERILKDKRVNNLKNYHENLDFSKVDLFFEKAKINCVKMSEFELKEELRKAKLYNLTNYVDLYQQELNNR